ncbi:hypothetical protein EC845_1498 [Comamonas sp. BIGb0124]|uniref:peptidase n=1 Tax=Comamonas sp. BIGb0124 TaxID=2485130 RepID=UPI000F48C1C9|nr:peptidase [Comamonas sp. BIGb0124]ROR22597.1 hypothetical protein EC845_1498 [Comamonas sp. BIGb0124]
MSATRQPLCGQSKATPVCLTLLLAGWISVLQPAQAVPPLDTKPGRCRSLTFDALDSLVHTRVHGNIHIRYATQGPHAIGSKDDRDGNGIPDRIDDLILQLATAQQVYDDVLGLTPPLRQPRYQLASRINVFVVKLDSGNGRAFDEVVNEKSSRTDPGLPCGIKIFIDSQVEPSSNITPAHELFHLYQYGYTMFKSRGYLEGMARWSETFFIDDTKIDRDQQRHGDAQCGQAMTQSYGASAFWRRQGKLSGEAPLVLPTTMRALRYSDDRPVITSRGMQGARYLRTTLESLAVASREQAIERRLPLYNWPEELQRSDTFDADICRAAGASGSK